ncbi:MAG: hypothetical protein JWM47_309 [Acidimicrobiales bacterium]|nr:hypothetical protein [Acidimicrobiales bacterium]
MDTAGGHEEASGTGLSTGSGPGRRGRSATRIVTAVAVAAAVLGGLAWWVQVSPYAGTDDLRCDARISWGGDPATRRQAEERFDRSCAEARRDRRDTALLVGAGVAIAVCAVSTVPSRRLTGDKLGPLR